MDNKYSERKNFLDDIYNKINGSRKKYGELKKCEFHIHTPASACYRFINPENTDKKDLEGEYLYSNLSTKEIVDYSYKIGYLSLNVYNDIIKNLDQYNSEEYKKNLKIRFDAPYDSFKEYITYMTIAYKLYKEDIKVAVVSDHNTVK